MKPPILAPLNPKLRTSAGARLQRVPTTSGSTKLPQYGSSVYLIERSFGKKNQQVHMR
jgi:hypothetical protein